MGGLGASATLSALSGDSVSVSAQAGRRYTLRKQENERDRKKRYGLNRG